MDTKVKQAENSLLSPQFNALANRVTLPSLHVTAKQRAPLKSLAPAFQASREQALLEVQRRRTAEYARQERERRVREQRASRQATFKFD